MAVSLSISPKELQRQAAACFEGKTYTVFLAANPGTLTSSSTAADWVAEEASGGGYAPVTGTIATGTYNTGTSRYELPTITATFTATGGGFSYNTLCLKIGTELYLHSITVESPSIVMAAGQTKAYTIILIQDD